jgi:hypothetical protein
MINPRLRDGTVLLSLGGGERSSRTPCAALVAGGSRMLQNAGRGDQ